MAQELITMTPRELLRYEIIQRLINKEIGGTEASKQLDLSIRQIKRVKAKVKKHGVKGIIHGLRGKSGNKGLPDEKIKQIKKIVEDKYYDFGPTFATEKLLEDDQIKISKEKLRQLMTDWGNWKPKRRKKNKEYRSWRQRKEQFGEMEQFDGSYHYWFEDRGVYCCLLASIDDATGKITGLKFVDWEGVKNGFNFWGEYFEQHNKPLSIYLDRHSTYKQNQKSVFDDPKCFTQFQRAMETDLGIKIIHAYSAQAKGRIERLFETLQDRLIKELRLANISTIKEANEFCKNIFIPKFNVKFAVKPQKKGNLHKQLTKWEKDNIDKIFSIQTKRTVSNDFTVRHQGKWYQLGQVQPTLVLRKDKVLMEERTDGAMFISLRNKHLNYVVLPKRPEKVNQTKVIALTRTKSSWKPPANHPWRRPFNPKAIERYQTSSSSVSAS